MVRYLDRFGHFSILQYSPEFLLFGVLLHRCNLGICEMAVLIKIHILKIFKVRKVKNVSPLEIQNIENS